MNEYIHIYRICWVSIRFNFGLLHLFLLFFGCSSFTFFWTALLILSCIQVCFVFLNHLMYVTRLQRYCKFTGKRFGPFCCCCCCFRRLDLRSKGLIFVILWNHSVWYFQEVWQYFLCLKEYPDKIYKFN